jgi:hypothetical protein
MINAYCGGLSETFAQLIYYGVLNDEDAQCFRVNTSIGNGFFVLAAATILLALMNTFVLKAVRHYERDQDMNANTQHHGKGLPAGDEYGDLARTRMEIHPVPVLFTDTFRWLLQREKIPKRNCSETRSILAKLNSLLHKQSRTGST